MRDYLLPCLENASCANKIFFLEKAGHRNTGQHKQAMLSSKKLVGIKHRSESHDEEAQRISAFSLTPCAGQIRHVRLSKGSKDTKPKMTRWHGSKTLKDSYDGPADPRLKRRIYIAGCHCRVSYAIRRIIYLINRCRLAFPLEVDTPRWYISAEIRAAKMTDLGLAAFVVESSIIECWIVQSRDLHR